MPPSFTDWFGVKAEISRIIARSPEPFTPETIANAHDFLALARNHCRIPESVAKGYWSTICVAWDMTQAGSLEIEIFGNRFEVYHFFDKRTDIWDERHVAGQLFSAKFLAELPSRG